MKISIILVSLFSFSVSLEMTTIDFGKKVLFDPSNHEFKIPYKGPPKNIFLFLISHEKEYLRYEMMCPFEGVGGTITKKESGIAFYHTEGTCTFKLEVNEGDKGSFIIYDFKALYEIKLKNKYGNKNVDMELDSNVNVVDYNESMSKLTFLVPNFRTNSKITFEYIENVEDFSPFENPFKVCHENICKENVTSYYFEKGKSYEIYVKIQKVSQKWYTRYMVPPFRFYAEDSEEAYSNDDIKYSYNETKPQPDPQPHSSSNYRRASIIILALLTLFLF